MNYPKAKKIPKTLIKHNHERIDNYYWLNDRENAEVIDYLNAENAYTKEQLEPTEALQKELYDEMIAKIVKDDSSVPYEMNGYWYYARYEEGKDYPVYCRKKEKLESDEIIILDVNVLAEGHAYYAVGGLSISPDNKMLCFGVDNVSRRIYTLYFKSLETGEIFEETIQNTTGGATWANDNKTLFFTQMEEETLRSHKIFRYELGSSNAVEIYHEKDDTFGVSVSKSKSKQYIMIDAYSTLSTETQILSADTPKDAFTMFSPRERDLEYTVEHKDDKFVIETNYEAKNFRLMECGLTQTNKGAWKELIAHREDVLLEGFELFNDFLVLEEKKNGLTEIRIINSKTDESYYLDFGEEVYDAYISSNLDFDTNLLRYGYNSLTTPNSTIEFNMNSKEKSLLKETEILGDFDKNNYESKRAWATAKDGKKIPISLVYKKGITVDGTNPTLQYAYGSYGYSMDASFSLSRLSLLDRGFVYAIAHIRGGEELGRAWYEDGKLLTKMNTFTDFIACSEYLIEAGYTSNEKLFAQGGSAGGMLMGGIVNMKSELYKGVVAQVPFVDVVTTMLDDTIPLTTGEYDEWGNPNDKEYYDYMLSYSPYDNVEKKAYPNMLVTTGLHDSQVQYWEPAKWVAKLRDYKTDNNTLLMHINMDTGHGGASGRFEAFKEVAMVQGFLLGLL
ncbi:MAG: Protease II (EC [uncultured Sulfurovum sp.]|uniref:Protease II (EC) n=1 Tax=uncultured Sulfurovum sp. TaxID=269237 RepID=A0A6S6TPU3_9BACT|nr:MAG: Protease II (EC [uncultured Sulfurovum sp.]